MMYENYKKVKESMMYENYKKRLKPLWCRVNIQDGQGVYDVGEL